MLKKCVLICPPIKASRASYSSCLPAQCRWVSNLSFRSLGIWTSWDCIPTIWRWSSRKDSEIPGVDVAVSPEAIGSGVSSLAWPEPLASHHEVLSRDGCGEVKVAGCNLHPYHCHPNLSKHGSDSESCLPVLPIRHWHVASASLRSTRSSSTACANLSCQRTMGGSQSTTRNRIHSSCYPFS